MADCATNLKMCIYKRQTQSRKIAYFGELLNKISDQKIEKYLGSFKEKLDFARYYIDNYEKGKERYNTVYQKHDIALIFKANAEASIFVLKSSLDCLANALNEIFDLGIKSTEVYFSGDLVKKLEDKSRREGNIKQDKIPTTITRFLKNNDYFFKLRNLLTHNIVTMVKYSIELPSTKIIMAFQRLPNVKNTPSNLEVDVYCNDMIDKIYSLAESVFKGILDKNSAYKKSQHLSNYCVKQK